MFCMLKVLNGVTKDVRSILLQHVVRNYSYIILINYLKIGAPNGTSSSSIKRDTFIIKNVSLIKIRFY